MTWIPRSLDVAGLLDRRSVLLFGPRQTGKTTYVQRQLGRRVALTFSLLDQGLLAPVLADPTRIRKEIEARDLRDTVICIDEIQWYAVLRDTLLAFELPAWSRTLKRKAVEGSSEGRRGRAR